MFITVEEINKNISDPTFVLKAEQEYLRNIKGIANAIAENRFQRPIVLLSGPSGSGKTTTAFLLEKEIEKMGLETHTLSLDNYFKTLTKEEKALNEEAKLDLESPDRVNIPLLNSQLRSIINCEEVEVPRFDFINSESVKGVPFKRKEGEVVVVEGIHALNPDVITLPDEDTDKIYISVRTRIKKGDELLHPSYVRLMRRILRDITGRGREPKETELLYEKVEKGAEKFIMPYKYRADYSIDTFFSYEVSVYKEKLMKLEGGEKLRFIKEFIKDIAPLSENCVPEDSLIREFIGNGSFKY